MASTGDLRALLGPATYSSIPNNTAVVLQQAWTSHTDTLKAQLEKVKVDSEQKVAELTAVNTELTNKLSVYSQETEKGQSALQQYREQAADSSTTAARLTTELSQATSEREDLKRQLFTARAERDDIAGLAERRLGEVERLAGEIKSLTEQVASAQGAKSEALVRMEEVESREVQLAHKEKRLTEEKEFMAGQVKMLQDELERRGEEVLSARREAGHKLAEMTQELAEQTEEARAAARKENLLRQEVEELRGRAEQLAERLKEARESETKLEEKFRAELLAQTKLATLYKSHSEEHNGKVEELSYAVKELQELLKESSEKYGKLEIELSEVNSKTKEEAEGQIETISTLKKELEDANKLLKTFREKGLSEDSIDSLSPSAAHASRLLKSGLTVTGIYSQMVGLGEELSKEKQETARLNLYIQQILEEVESRAPQLKKQREDYEKVMAAVGGLTDNLEAAREEVELRRSEAEEARRSLKTMERERDRLEMQVSDLGKQVSTLVRDADTGRGSGRRQSPRQPQHVDVASADSVIEGRLLTFHNVVELQQKNIELLAVVRELSAGQEAAEATRLEEKTAEVRQELDTALRQVEELRAARERQQLMVENIIQQKEMYKSMVSGQSSSTPTKASEVDKIKLQKELEEIKKDFTEYKEEKGVNDKMVSETVDKLREDLHQSRLKVAKLSSQEEYSTERFKIMNTNHESLKRQLTALEDRNKQLHNISAQHETSVTALRRELMDCQTKLSRAEVQSEHLQMKNGQLAATQARIEAERDVLLKEKSSNSRIEANLQQIQLNLERNEELGKMKLESNQEQLKKEVELLRKKVESEQEQYKDSVRTWEMANKELRDKSEAAIVGEKAAMEQLSAMTNTLETMKEELHDKTEQLQLAESRLAGRGLGRQGSLMEGQGESRSSRLRDVELLMAQTKQELKSVNTQLVEAKRRADEYKGISEAAEARMVESSATMQELQGQLEGKVKHAEAEKELAEKKAGKAEVENRELVGRVKELESEAGASGGELRERLRTSLSELDELKIRLSSAESVEKEAKEEASRLGKEAREAQEKYEREIVQHAKDIETLNKLKNDIKSKSSHKAEWESERKRLNEKMNTLTKKHKEELQNLKNEKMKINEQLEAVSGENSSLHKQLERVSQQMTDMTAAGLNTSGSADTSLNTSLQGNTSINEEEANTTQLMAIIKYLRQEKEILSGRLEVLQAETARTQSQLEHQIKIATDNQATLDRERQVQSQSVMSASKHSELIRKVETLSAVTDSNRMLREEKEKLEKDVHDYKEAAAKAESLVTPLEEKLKVAEERVSTLQVEKHAQQSEAEKWKKRSDQLVEKSFKINPEELAKLQEAKTQLTRSLNTATAEKRQFEEKLNVQTKDLEAARQQLTVAQQEAKKYFSELQEKGKEYQVVKRESMAAKNVQANLQREINNLKKKAEDLEKSKADLNASILATATKHKQELVKAKKDAEESKAGGDDLGKVKKELEDAQKNVQEKETEAEKLKKDVAEKEAELAKNKSMLMQLKKIGRNFREKAEAAEKNVNDLSEEKRKVEEELDKIKAEGVAEGSGSNSDELDEAQRLLEESQVRLGELEAQNEELKKEKEELAKASEEKETRAKNVLKNARAKIQKVEEEKKELKESLEQMTTGGSSEEQDLRRKALASQLNSVRQDKDKLEVEKSEAIQEKEKLMEEVEKLQQELVAAQLSAQGGVTKPVAVAGVVQQQEKPVCTAARKQQQPQAHIQPHRHTPRDYDRHTQTASIRPMAQRATTQAVVLPSQVSSGQVEVATVQPTVSISPSVSSAGGTSAPQLPSTSQPQQLDPSAPEFYPAPGAAGGQPDQGEEPPRAVVTPRQDQPQASTSGPSAANLSNAPSTSGASGHGGASPSTPTTASVPPTLKRPRDTTAPDSDSQSSVEERAGPSGYQKKARTISSTEFLQVSSGGAEVVEMGGVSGSQETMVESDSSMQVDVGERREVGSSSSQGVDMVGTSGEAASSGVATSSQEEVLDSEQEGDAEEDGEISEGMEEVEGQELDDNLDVGSDEDEENDQEEAVGEANSEEEILVDQPEGIVEDNSSEPSSSTGARQVGRSVAGSSLPGPGFEQDQGESDSVVPTTPKLPLPRRQNDGFAEAVSSPQVPSSDRFVFGSGQASSGLDVIVTSSNSGLPGQEGLDRTAVDIQQFATGGDRAGSQQQEPAEGGVDGGEDSEEGGVSSIVSSTEQQAGQGRPVRARQAIVWEDQNSGGSTSSGPQRHGVGARGARGGLTRGATARRSRPGSMGARRGQ